MAFDEFIIIALQFLCLLIVFGVSGVVIAFICTFIVEFAQVQHKKLINMRSQGRKICQKKNVTKGKCKNLTR